MAGPVTAQEPIVGEIRLWPSNTPPPGWLICDGSNLSVSTYGELYSLLNFTYGGTFPSDFAIPDLRGRVPVGRSSGDADFGTLGDTGGEKTHTLTVGEMPSHRHTLRVDTIGSAALSSGPGRLGAQGAPLGRRTTGTEEVVLSDAINLAGDGQPHNNLQPYQVINYIIYTGVGLPTPTPTATPTATATPTSGGSTGPLTGTISGAVVINQSAQHAYTTTLQTGNSFALIRSASYGEIIAGSGALLVAVVVVFHLVYKQTVTNK